MLKALVCFLILSTTLGTYIDLVMDPFISPDCLGDQLFLQRDFESNEEESFNLQIITSMLSEVNEDYEEVQLGFLQFEAIHEEEQMEFSLHW